MKEDVHLCREREGVVVTFLFLERNFIGENIQSLINLINKPRNKLK